MLGKRGFMCVMLILVITCFPIIGIYSDEQPVIPINGDTRHKTAVPSSYIPHESIIIRNNSDFASQGWPGSGVPNDPYIIEKLNVTSDRNCIDIRNTTVYFEIYDCLLTHAGDSRTEGILLVNVTHGKIINCSAELHLYAFHFWNCSDCTAMNNTARDNYGGFYCYESSNCTMNNNTANDNSYGFDILASSSLTIRNNTLNNNGLKIGGNSFSYWAHSISGNEVNGLPLGYFQSESNLELDCAYYGQILLVNCSQVTAKNATYTNRSTAIQLAYCNHCSLINITTSVDDSGFSLIWCPYSILINNTSSGFRLSSCNSSIMINNTASRAGVILYSSYNSTLVNNTVNNGYAGFDIESSSYCNLHHNIASNNYEGFHIYDSNYCNLTDNIAIESIYTGFYISKSSYFKIHNNILSSRGINIMGDSLDCWLHDIVNNTIDGKDLGYFRSMSNFMLDSSNFGQVILANCTSVTIMNGVFDSPTIGVQLTYCTECNLINNTVNNTWDTSWVNGFLLICCKSCTLMNNVVRDNMIGFGFFNSSSLILQDCVAAGCYEGIFLTPGSSSCIITNNVIIDNTIGLHIDRDCSSNLIYLNYFANNSMLNGVDDGFSNNWDNGTHGNFWNDWNCIGGYSIPGTAGSVDNHPCLYESSCPTSSTTPSIGTTTTTTGESGFLPVIVTSSVLIGSAVIICLVVFLFIRTKKSN
ncbi:MAG: right-handed parallel beta-helix repeat-containing protein [Candidatus Thorarchaeota archaeon]|nr:right-handed parallel beta-helix repeat-containing protein [Candidatus Thorarchaeota archaeon]